MREAVLVSTARTAIGRAFRGSFNGTKSPTMMSFAILAAMAKAGLEPDIYEDVLIGTVLGAGTSGSNIARQAVFASGLPVGMSAQTIDRQCASGLMAIATGAKQIMVDGMDVVVAGGQENISAVQREYFDWVSREQDSNVIARAPHAYMPMLQTAEFVAAKYRVSREAQDEYALVSQQRVRTAQMAGLFDEEIVPVSVRMVVDDKLSQHRNEVEVLLRKDECNRPETTVEGLASLRPVLDGGTVTAGNASSLSDGASACVLVERTLAERRGIKPLAVYRGMAVAGVAPEEMGIGPVYAIPKLLRRNGLNIQDIGVWELNEAFACQALYCRDHLGIDPSKYNINGGAIAIGHPYGMTGARLVGHAVLEAKRRNERYAVVAMCVGGGMGAAALLEVV